MKPVTPLRVLAVTAMLTTSSCFPMPPTVTYNMSLTEVQRPANVAERWGDFTLEKSQDGFTYQDDLLQLLVVPARGSFLLTIENKTDHSMQFVWDQASYVSPDGISSPVVSGETRCIQMGESRPPEPVPANARAVITVIPNSLIYTPYGGG